MTLRVYYNEIDGTAAAWLRELVRAGHLPGGDVDERDIRDVSPVELMGYDQCHFFAGIGGWSHALRLAGWRDDRRVWTGSCPCQPFSAAGKREGIADERHLWPHWHHLISVCRPPVVFGEQVASKDGLGWLDLVCADLEGSGYAVGAADLCAAGVGAPHIRQRLFFGSVRLADADSQRRDGIDALLRQEQGDPVEAAGSGEADGRANAADARLSVGRGGSSVEPGSVEQSERLLADGWLADAGDDGSQGRVRGWPDAGREALDGSAGCDRADLGMADAASGGHQSCEGNAGIRASDFGAGSTPLKRGSVCSPDAAPTSSPTNGHWRDADWLFCRDGKWRPVEPGTFPLAHGLPARVGRLRGYGNAIVPQVAADFIRSVM